MQQDLTSLVKTLQHKLAGQSPKKKWLIAVGSGVGLILIALMISGTSAQDDISAAPSDSGTGSSKNSEPGYMDALRDTRNYAEKYWSERFVNCGDGRTFSVEETMTGRRYLVIQGFNPDTLPPYRENYADRYNEVWYAISGIRAKAIKWCGENGNCQDYKGGFWGAEAKDLGLRNEGTLRYFAVLRMTMKKGLIEIEDPFKDLFRPTCDEIQALPLWNEH